jgi:hypothetical protein
VQQACHALDRAISVRPLFHRAQIAAVITMPS